MAPLGYEALPVLAGTNSNESTLVTDSDVAPPSSPPPEHAAVVSVSSTVPTANRGVVVRIFFHL